MLPNKSEQAFWRWLRPRMTGHWLASRHEDRGISPGTPDLHYGFTPDSLGKYQTGWLELKATALLTPKTSIKIEASQHQYCRTWGRAVPIHFLILVVDEVLLVPSEHHLVIPRARYVEEIREIALVWFNKDLAADMLPPVLRNITRVK